MVLKRILIAMGLLVFCVVLLAGVKSYGVWVISVVAVVLFLVGLLRKQKPDGTEGKGEGHDGHGER